MGAGRGQTDLEGASTLPKSTGSPLALCRQYSRAYGPEQRHSYQGAVQCAVGAEWAAACGQPRCSHHLILTKDDLRKSNLRVASASAMKGQHSDLIMRSLGLQLNVRLSVKPRFLGSLVPRSCQPPPCCAFLHLQGSPRIRKLRSQPEFRSRTGKSNQNPQP